MAIVLKLIKAELILEKEKNDDVHDEVFAMKPYGCSSA